ncbi:TetR/AcrR family transcriptional regulator [Hyphomonas sp.]|uniref:TetR/AcrR family transcriptional regulator n=1 Tax=Hyphomonas sp. TaxID=87 RepID=UPI00391B170B
MSQPLEFETSPAERRRQKVRGAILEAAERVFSVEGEAGLSIRRLAEEIDYSPSAIYKYFGSKEELVDELKEAFFSRLMESVDHAVIESLAFDDRVKMCFKTYIRVAAERPHHYLAAFSSLGTARSGTQGEDWANFQDMKKGQAFNMVASLVQEGQQKGVFCPDMDPFQAAKSLWASMHGLALLLIHMPRFPELMPNAHGVVSTDAFTDFHAELMARSLRAATVVSTFPSGKNEPTDV